MSQCSYESVIEYPFGEYPVSYTSIQLLSLSVKCKWINKRVFFFPDQNNSTLWPPPLLQIGLDPPLLIDVHVSIQKEKWYVGTRIKNINNEILKRTNWYLVYLSIWLGRKFGSYNSTRSSFFIKVHYGFYWKQIIILSSIEFWLIQFRLCRIW